MPLPPDPSEVDAAVLAKLAADAQLKALAPDGIYFDVPEQGKTRVVIVSIVLHQDHATFNAPGARRDREITTYLVKATLKGASGTDAKAAALRIDRVLEDQPLVIVGYTWLSTRRTERVRYQEPDPMDQSLRWQHRGGRYRVEVAPQPQ